MKRVFAAMLCIGLVACGNDKHGMSAKENPTVPKISKSHQDLLNNAKAIANEAIQKTMVPLCDPTMANPILKTSTLGTMSSIQGRVEPGALPAIIAQFQFRCFDRTFGRDLEKHMWVTFAIDDKYGVRRCAGVKLVEDQATELAASCGFRPD